jgi:Fe-Mn family superoxide dismutase
MPAHRTLLTGSFYLDYKNVKPDYLANIWKVINWDEAEKRLAAAA